MNQLGGCRLRYFRVDAWSTGLGRFGVGRLPFTNGQNWQKSVSELFAEYDVGKEIDSVG